MKDIGIDLRRDKIELELEEPGRLTGGFLAPFVDTDLRTSLEGLYACSPIQFAAEVAAPTYVVLGWRAGEKAAEYAKATKQAEPDGGQVEAENTRATSPLGKADGPTWREANKELNNIMEEFKKYVAGFYPTSTADKRSRAGLENCLEQLEKLKLFEMRAADPHELVRCREVVNLIEVGEMMVRAALDDRQYEGNVWFIGRKRGNHATFRTKPIPVKYPPREAS